MNDRLPHDPQIRLEGTLKSGEMSDVIVFSLRFLLIEMIFIVTVPLEGETRAPVYVKFKIHRSRGSGYTVEGEGT